MEMKILDNMAIKYGTDKSSQTHNYCEKYEKYLPFKRNAAINILEIGVLNGGSLKMWKEYFYCSRILGIDIISDSRKYAEEDIYIEIGSQTDGGFLKTICEKYGRFDLIIDDGSHMNSDIIFSFEHLFGSLNSGGVYVVEDASVSYWEFFGGKLRTQGTVIEYFKNIIDEVNFAGEFQESVENVHARREDLLLDQFIRKGYECFGIHIESINFINGLILITKR